MSCPGRTLASSGDGAGGTAGFPEAAAGMASNLATVAATTEKGTYPWPGKSPRRKAGLFPSQHHLPSRQETAPMVPTTDGIAER